MNVGETLSKKRWGGGGLLLAALLVVLLIAPLVKLGKINHPLAGAQQLDLCALLPATPVMLGTVNARPDTARSTCAYVDKADKRALSVSLTSTRQLTGPDGGGNTEKYFETWMKEVRMSYGNGTDLPAAGWRHAGAWKYQGREALVFEDGGVMVQMESDRLDAGQLARYAEAVQQALRKK